MSKLFWQQLEYKYGKQKTVTIQQEVTDYIHYLLSRNWWISRKKLVTGEGGMESMIQTAAAYAATAPTIKEGLIEWSAALVKEYRHNRGVDNPTLPVKMTSIDRIPDRFLVAPAPLEPLVRSENYSLSVSRPPLCDQLTAKELEVAETVASVGGKKEAGELLGMSQHAVSNTLFRIRKRLAKQGDMTYDEYRTMNARKAVAIGNHNRYHTVFPNPFCDHCEPRRVTSTAS
jgi:hypothetical protein